MTRGDLRGCGGVRLIDHEAGLRERTRGVVALNGRIHRGAMAEVVAGEDESFQNVGRAGMVAGDADLANPVTRMQDLIPLLALAVLLVAVVASIGYWLLASAMIAAWMREPRRI